MKKSFFLFSVVVITCFLIITSCGDKKFEDGLQSKIIMLDFNDYFPLHVGNYWELNSISKRVVKSKESINDTIYYKMISGFDTLLYRKSEDGKVYEKRNSEKEILKFDLTAQEGETWQYEDDDSGYLWNVTLTNKNETIKLDNYTFRNCYSFYFDVPQLADEEYTICLAPGIGFVEEYFFGGGPDRNELKRVSINGVEIQF